MQKLLVALCVSTFLFMIPMVTGAAGLVPCGGASEPPCQTCHVVQLTNNVVGWLVMILGTIAAILIVVAGVRLVTSGGNTSAKEAAKSSMTNLIIGYLIVLSAWLVLDYGLKALLIQDGTRDFGVWNQVSCVAQPVAEYNEFEQLEVRIAPSGLNATRFTAADVTVNTSAIATAGDVRSMAEAAARAAGITDPGQIRIYVALINQESSMCRNKLGPETRYGRAYGCGQMLLSTAQGLDPSATADRLLNDNAYNLALSSRFFAQQLRRYNGNVTLTLASYNGGDKANVNSTVCPGQLSWQCEQNEGYEQTRNYVANIISVAGRL